MACEYSTPSLCCWEKSESCAQKEPAVSVRSREAFVRDRVVALTVGYRKWKKKCTDFESRFFSLSGNVSHLIMIRHRVFSTVSGSPLLFWIFRMSVERREERCESARALVSFGRREIEREGERRARRHRSSRRFRLSFIQKSDDDKRDDAFQIHARARKRL